MSPTTPTHAKHSSRRIAIWAVQAAVILAFWILAWVQSVAWRFYVTRDRPVPLSLEFIATMESIMFGIGALLTPAVIYAARRFRLERGRWVRSALAHLVCGAIFTFLVKCLWDVAIWHWYPTPWIARGFTWAAFLRSLMEGLQANMLLYWIVVCGVTAVDHANRYWRVSVEAAQLRAQLAESRLEILRTQLDPHFLFNTLHSISAMLYSDPSGADLMIANLSELLRQSLDQRECHQIPLMKEIAFTQLYLDIQMRRFEDRMEVRYEISPQAEHAEVPGMILQPLVENSVRYAIAPRISGGKLTVRAEVHDSELCLEVEDEGGAQAHPPAREGVGLSTTRERLRTMYGDRASLDLLPGRSGLRARIVLPFTTEGYDDAGMPFASDHCRR